jgi:hypothetical protein
VIRSIFLLIVGGAVTFAAASAPVIGIESSQSAVTLDNSRVLGNATVFDGSTVQTEGYSRIHLNNGTRLDLGADSRAQVFANRVSLERGTSEIQSAGGFELDARMVIVKSTNANSIARVQLDGTKGVLVTALNAPVNVLNREGMLVARVTPGMPMSFLPQAGASTGFESTGCVLQKDGAGLLVDPSGSPVTELRGFDLRKLVGNQAKVSGTVDSSAKAAGGATQVVNVTGATQTKKGGCSSVAKKVGATTAAAGLAAGVGAGAAGAGAAAAGAGAVAAGAAAGAGVAAAAGISTTVLVVGGVAAAAAVGGVVAATSGKSSP